MNEEVKALWLAALRSGEYLQGKDSLHSINDDLKDAYCCLGVLCEVAVNEGIIPEPENAFGDTDLMSRHYDGKWDIPSSKVVEWAGLEEDNPTVNDEEGLTLRLSELNDEYGYNFEQIARVIEEQL